MIHPPHLLFSVLQVLGVLEKNGRFSYPLLFADAGMATWLLIAFHQFLNLPSPLLHEWAGVVAGLSLLSWTCGLHRDWRGRGFNFVGQALLYFCIGNVALRFVFHRGGNWAINDRVSWLTAALLVGLIAGRVVWWKLRDRGDWAPLETLRWILLGGTASWGLWPLFTVNPGGAGDAYWYVLVLSDYLEQIRESIFPVWLGQTEYAFNGAFSPLRLAPGFQHAGALVDLLTGRTLSYLAVKNLLLAVNALATAFSAYFCLRAILPQRPNAACALALAFVLSPGFLTPLNGDQYMTFLAAPFLPIVCYGCWRAFTRNDVTAHVVLGAGIAGLWLCHTPVALWTSLFITGLYAAKVIIHYRSGRETKMIALALLTYIVLGIYPVISALSLDNVSPFSIVGQQVLDELKLVFPAILQPVNPLGHASNNQPGYTALAAGLIGLSLALGRRNAAALAFGAASILVALLITPIPGLSPLIWDNMPQFILKISNTWIYQRLAIIWTILLLFTLAAAVAAKPLENEPIWLRLGGTFLACAALGWSAREAGLLRITVQKGITRGSGWEVLYTKPNLILTRYSYSSFESAPSYFSHAFMEPRLESRLLSRGTREILLSNGDNAASAGPGRTLVTEGVFRAHSDNNSVYYKLQPNPTIQPARYYALRIDFLTPGETGYLQIRAENLFREYILPNSGVGMLSRPLPRAFGSMPTSSPIVPLFTNTAGPVPLFLTLILPARPVSQEFDSARFQLWEYDPLYLPIATRKLTPYRAGVDSPEPAYLESPRMWLSGYSATVDDKPVPVLRSPDNLCMVEVPVGNSEVEIKYTPQLRLVISYWVTVWGWASLLVGAAVWQLRRCPLERI